MMIARGIKSRVRVHRLCSIILDGNNARLNLDKS